MNIPTSNEALRIKAEYERREVEVDRDLYAPWQPSEILMTAERKRVAAAMLKKRSKFPAAGDRCLEIGYGRLGWLADLLSWGLQETDLYGIELDEVRAKRAIKALPMANLLVGDAELLPWDNDFFDYAIISTVLSSILDPSLRRSLALEAGRVVRPGGAIVIYDLAVNNPSNPNVRGVKRSEIETLFPDFHCDFRSTTLAPPLARALAGRCWVLAEVLSVVPLLRTHVTAVLIKH